VAPFQTVMRGIAGKRLTYRKLCAIDDAGFMGITYMLVLSVFPGIGLLDMAFEEEGFCVVRGPDVLWGGDIRQFDPPPGVFAGVIGGPPCQKWSRMQAINRSKGIEPVFGNLIPEFERCVCASRPQWFVMENVPDAPVPAIPGYGIHSFILNNRQCSGVNDEPARQHRSRRWSFGWRGARRVLGVDVLVFENPVWLSAAIAYGTKWDSDKKRPAGKTTRARFRELLEKQGLPEDFDLPPFSVKEKCKAVGNGVPLPMGRAIARAVKEVCDAEKRPQGPPQDDQPPRETGQGAEA